MNSTQTSGSSGKSSSGSETGHANMVANFDTLIAFVTGYGTAYNPSKASLKLTALQALAVSAKSAMATVNTTHTVYSNTTAAREVAFEPLGKLSTRIGNAVKATETTTQVDENVRTLVRKLQGKRASAKLSDEELQTLKANGKDVKQISAAQQSFDSKLETFDQLIKLLSGISLYVPNEADLKVTALTTLYNDLKTKNTAVTSATVQLSNARISRNDILYKPLAGLVDTAVDAKNYIKSVFGATSPQYKQISGLKFIGRL